MFRAFDILILTSAIISLLLSVFLYLEGDSLKATYVGIWVPSIMGFGIYVKLLRIVHFVLYKKILKESPDHE